MVTAFIRIEYKDKQHYFSETKQYTDEEFLALREMVRAVTEGKFACFRMEVGKEEKFFPLSFLRKCVITIISNPFKDKL